MAVALVATLALGACGGAPRFMPGEVEFSAPAGSGEPNLYVTADGRVVITWLEPVTHDPDDRRHALRVAVRADGRWSNPRTIVESDDLFVNWADFPSLIELPDGTWLVHWLQKVAPRTYAYHVKLALSKDQGATWSAPFSPHRDDSPTEHGFVAMVPWVDGGALVWLDGRQMTGEGGTGKGEGEHTMGAMTLRFTTVRSDGALGADVLLDDRTCECCQTALARTASGLVAAYRDRSEGEIRDIAVVRYLNGSWMAPKHVANDAWHYPGCPVNGPALSAAGDTVAIAWFTAAAQQPRVYVAFSTDGGAVFGAPVRVDQGRPIGRVDIALLPDGAALVSWLEAAGEDGAEVRARRVQRSGRADASWRIATTSAARFSGFPRLAAVGDEIVFAWTASGLAPSVQVVAVRLGG